MGRTGHESRVHNTSDLRATGRMICEHNARDLFHTRNTASHQVAHTHARGHPLCDLFKYIAYLKKHSILKLLKALHTAAENEHTYTIH